jgi:hypothetical protein
LARMGISKGEEDGIASGKRFSTRHRKDCVVDSTSLDLRYPLFASGVTVHLSLRTMDDGYISLVDGSPRESCSLGDGGWRGTRPAGSAPAWVSGPDSHDRQARGHSGGDPSHRRHRRDRGATRLIPTKPTEMADDQDLRPLPA